MSKREKKSTGNPMLRTAIFSVVLSVLLVVILACLGGILILNGILPESMTGPLAIVAVFLAALLGPMPLVKAGTGKKLPMAYGVFGVLAILMLLTKWIAWPGDNFANWWVLPAGLIGATLAGVLGAKKPKRKKY